MSRQARASVPLFAALGVAFGAALAACGGPRAVPAERDPALPEIARVSGSTEDLGGRWAVLQVTTTEASSALAGTVLSTNRQVFVADAVELDGAFALDGTLCAMDIETSTGMADTEVPDAFVAAYPPLTWRGRVERSADGVALVLEPSVEALGLDPAADTLTVPAQADDPRVVDADGDGHPGVTIRVTGLAGGEMYFVQRATRAMQVDTLTPNTIAGPIAWSSERVVLDATSRMLRNARPAVPTAGPDGNRFRMTRVAAHAGCDEVVAAGRALFGDFEIPETEPEHDTPQPEPSEVE